MIPLWSVFSSRKKFAFKASVKSLFPTWWKVMSDKAILKVPSPLHILIVEEHGFYYCLTEYKGCDSGWWFFVGFFACLTLLYELQQCPCISVSKNVCAHDSWRKLYQYVKSTFETWLNKILLHTVALLVPIFRVKRLDMKVSNVLVIFFPIGYWQHNTDHWWWIQIFQGKQASISLEAVAIA